MSSSHWHLRIVSIMLSQVLFRSSCLLAAEVSRCPRPTLASVLRALTTSSPGDAPCASVVTYSQLKTMLFNRNIQLFDVRNPDEFEAGRLPHAVNIPLGTLEESLKLSPEHFQQKFDVRAPGKEDDNIVFQCRSGKRSADALNIARQLGFRRARHYKGGYLEWAEQEGK